MVNNDTIIKLKLRCKGAPISVYDLDLNFIKSFFTMKKTAKFLGLFPGSVSKYLAKGTFLNI